MTAGSSGPSAVVKLPWWVGGLCVPMFQLVLALLVTGALIWAVGESPWATLKVMLLGALNPSTGLPSTLYYATSLVFTGLAVTMAFHAGLFNIGAEGQAYMAGLAVALVCLGLDAHVSPWLLFALVVPAAALGGALWASLPGALQAYRGAHVVVTTIMFNYIAAGIMNYLLVNQLKSAGGMAIETRSFAASALLPKAHEWLAGFGIAMPPSLLNVSSLIAIAAVVFVWWLLWYTRLGYALRAMGQNPRAIQYAGLNGRQLVVVAMVISGALAGLMALNDVYGAQNRLVLNYTGGMGFLGIAVALMGRNHPLGVLAAALLFGALYQGSTDLQLDFPRVSPELLLVIQGLVVFFAAALDKLVREPVESVALRWLQLRAQARMAH